MNKEVCRSCGAPVFWADVLTKAGVVKRMIIDVDPVPRGNIGFRSNVLGEQVMMMLAPGSGDGDRYQSHFVSCPDQKRWQKREEGSSGSEKIAESDSGSD
jgi:hypothetical protein